MFKFKYVLCALAALPLATAASAARFDLVDDFGASVFQYGAGDYANGVVSFTAFTSTYSNCFGVSGFTCTTSGPAGNSSGSSNLPGIGVTTDGAEFLTVKVAADELWAHPAQGGGNTDAMIRFTAANTGFYSLSTMFQRLDTMTSGSNDPGNNGVSVAIYKTGLDGTSVVFSSNLLQGANVIENSSVGYNGGDVFLSAGDSLYWAVDNNGNYYNDSTGISGALTFRGVPGESVLAVPEPATWALTLMGFGLAGLGLRATRRRPVALA